MFYELLNQDWKFRNCSLSFFIVLSMVANLPTILLVPRKATAIALDLIPQSIVFSSTEFCCCELLVYDFALCRAISSELTCSQLLCLIESRGDLDKLKKLYHIGFNKILGFDMNSFISCSCTKSYSSNTQFVNFFSDLSNNKSTESKIVKDKVCSSFLLFVADGKFSWPFWLLKRTLSFYNNIFCKNIAICKILRIF